MHGHHLHIRPCSSFHQKLSPSFYIVAYDSASIKDLRALLTTTCKPAYDLGHNDLTQHRTRPPSHVPAVTMSSAPESNREGSTGSPQSAMSNPTNEWQDSTGTATEDTPLLAREGDDVEASDRSQPQSSSAASLLRSFQGGNGNGKPARRWPSLLALLLLCIVVVLIIIFGFLAPSIVEEYSMQAATFKPTGLSIDSFTATGVRARIQGDFYMDASKVEKKPVRDLGRFGTWIAREVESGQSQVQVSLPEYGNVVLGTAEVPRIKVDVRNGHTTHVDFLSDLEPGNIDGVKRLAKDWLDGRLGELRVLGRATVPIKSGLFSFGTQKITQSLLFSNKDVPAIPKYKIKDLKFHDVELPDLSTAMAADVVLEVENDYPVDFTIPPLGFAILVDNCSPDDPYIQLADATTPNIHIQPKTDLQLNVSGIVRKIPDSFRKACPGKHESPMDQLLGNYIHGEDTTIHVRGSDSPSQDTPKWITDIVSDITVPVPFPGHSFGHLIKNFSLADVHFRLPDPFAEPDSAESNPRISANIKALIALPREMDLNISVGRVRALADVFYHGSKLGVLNLDKWQAANSTRVEPKGEDGPTLLVQSLIDDAPLDITDEDVFTDLLQSLLFGGTRVLLTIKANVDVELETALGQLAVRKIPAQGVVPVKRS